MKYNNTNICVRLSIADAETIARLVDQGVSINTSDFIRTAVREKISKCNIDSEKSRSSLELM
jgi:Arc/MetJ-type ribon-helix-helix transcriptional regulator